MDTREGAIARAVIDHLPAIDRNATPELLEEGFGSIVLKIGGSVVRAARNDDARRGHELEAELLPIVAGSLPVAVPKLAIVPSSPTLPYGATVHRFLPGRPMTVEDFDRWPMLADEVAALLLALHGTTLAELPRVRRWRAGEILSGLGGALSRARDRSQDEVGFDARWAESRRWVSVHHPDVLCHGDAWFGNMLVDPAIGHLTGVVDFESAVVADPAFDLASVFHMPSGFGERCLNVYRASSASDPDLRARVEAHRFLREITGLDYAMRNELFEEIADVLEHIRALLREQ